MGLLFFVLALGVGASAEARDLEVRANPVNGNNDIYELSINNQVVIRYRTLSEQYDAVTRSRIIAERMERFADQGKLKEEYIRATTVNGLPVVSVNGELLATVTELDARANNSTKSGLIQVWAENVRSALRTQSTSVIGQVHPYEEKVVELVNIERAKVGLSPLRHNPDLARVARVKSEDMRDNNYFSHNSPTYGTPFDMMRHFNISYRTAGENIAAGQTSPEQVVRSWMNSPGHRANILNSNYEEIGVGFAQGGSYRYYWTQLFRR